jgi:hypothetical protein
MMAVVAVVVLVLRFRPVRTRWLRGNAARNRTLRSKAATPFSTKKRLESRISWSRRVFCGIEACEVEEDEIKIIKANWVSWLKGCNKDIGRERIGIVMT